MKIFVYLITKFSRSGTIREEVEILNQYKYAEEQVKELLKDPDIITAEFAYAIDEITRVLNRKILPIKNSELTGTLPDTKLFKLEPSQNE